MNAPLTFDALRIANLQRVGRFTNNSGSLCHTNPDGSDWAPSDWFMALMGEIGELAEARSMLMLSASRGSAAEMRVRAIGVKHEIADVQTYLDLFAARTLDGNDHADETVQAKVMLAVMQLGAACNELKKMLRGDHQKVGAEARIEEQLLKAALTLINARALFMSDGIQRFPEIAFAPGLGVDLGAATREKFNMVSDRVGCEVKL